jgi:hypothetical protein
MTLADRIYALLIELGPSPACLIATTLRKRKADVLIALHSDPRFVQYGKRRASRWDAAPAHSFTMDDVVPLWGFDAEQFVAVFEQRGLVERMNGNGRLRVTEYGLELSVAWLEAGGVTA